MLETNKIHLGDSFNLIKEIPDNSIDLIYVDVPYLYVNGGTAEGDFGDRFSKKRKELKDSNIYSGFDLMLLDQFKRVLKKTNIFIWCSRLQVQEIMNRMNEKDVNFDILVWCKTNPQPGTNNTWLSDLEYCLYFREKGVRLNDGYELKSKWYLSSINKRDKDEYLHPTIKSLDMVKKHIAHATQPGDVILDCFSGSGTTCVAAKELGRRFIGIEIDETYHRISIDRLNGISANGQTSIFTDFDELQFK